MNNCFTISKLKRNLLLCLEVVCLLLMNMAVVAEETGFKVGMSNPKTLIVEKRINFKERKYKDVEIAFLDRAINGNQGPDKELVSLVSAMKEQDYEWWLSVWNNQSKQIIKQLDRTESLKKNRVDRWVQLFSESRYLYLDKWLEFDNAVVIAYNLKNESKKIIDKKIILFRLVDGKWFADLTINQKFLMAIYDGEDLKDIVVR